MSNVTLYIQARRNVEAQEDEVLLGSSELLWNGFYHYGVS